MLLGPSQMPCEVAVDFRHGLFLCISYGVGLTGFSIYVLWVRGD